MAAVSIVKLGQARPGVFQPVWTDTTQRRAWLLNPLRPRHASPCGTRYTSYFRLEFSCGRPEVSGCSLTTTPGSRTYDRAAVFSC